MRGIWSLPVNLSGTSFTDSSAVAQIVFQFIFLGGVVFGLYRQPPKSNNGIRNGFRTIRYSGYVLVGWYLLTIFDLFLHEGRLDATYGYIMFYFFITALRFTADVLMLTGTLRLVYCLISQRIYKPLMWIHIGELVIIIMVMMVLFHLGSYFANEFLWLSIADPDIISEVSSHKDGFEAAFFILQWLMTLYMGALIVIALFEDITNGPRGEDQSQDQPAYVAVPATIVLWIRSFSEFIIVIHYHLLQHPSSNGTDAARDFIYGLCTSVFLFLIAFVAADESCKEHQDPVAQLIEGDIRAHTLSTIKHHVDESGLPPALEVLLGDLLQNPEAALSENTKRLLGEEGPNTIVREYVEKIRQRWGGLRPVDQFREF